MEKNRTAKNTFASYKPHFSRMLSLWIHKKWITSIYSLWNLNETDLIPLCDQYVNSIDSDSSKEMAVNAYKKVIVENNVSVTTNPLIIPPIFRYVTLWNENLANKTRLKKTKLSTWQISALISNPTET